MGNFNNSKISSLWIDGKPVKRASLGGKIFFEKHDYELTVSVSEQIIQIGDETVLTACLTDYNVPVSGKTVIFSSDVFKSTVVSETGTYDFGDYVTIDLSNFKNIDSLSSGNDGKLVIGSSSTYLNIWGMTFNNYIFCDYYRNGSEIDSVQVSLNHPLIIRDGVLYCKKYIGGQQLRDYTLDVSDVDFTEWEFFGKVIGVDVTVGEYWWASDVTDSNGEAHVSYVGKGAGDLNIQVECMNLQKTWGILDLIVYDNAISDRSSEFNITQVDGNAVSYSLTHDAQNKYYVLTRGGQTNREVYVWLPPFSFDECIFELDFYIASANPTVNGYNLVVCVYDNNTGWGTGGEVGTWSSSKIARVVKNASVVNSSNPGSWLGKGIWYTAQITITKNQVTSKIIRKDNGAVMVSATKEDTFNFGDTIYPRFWVMSGVSSTQYFTNIKVTPLNL